MSHSNPAVRGSGELSLGPLAHLFWSFALNLYHQNAKLYGAMKARKAVATSMAAALVRYVEFTEDPASDYARVLAAPFGEVLDRIAASAELPGELRAQARMLSRSMREFLRQVDGAGKGADSAGQKEG